MQVNLYTMLTALAVSNQQTEDVVYLTSNRGYDICLDVSSTTEQEKPRKSKRINRKQKARGF